MNQDVKVSPFVSIALRQFWQKGTWLFLSIILLFSSFFIPCCVSRPGDSISLEPFTKRIKGADDKLIISLGHKVKIEFGKKRMEAVVQIEKLDRDASCTHLALVLLNQTGEIISEAAPLEIFEDDLKKINSRRKGSFEVRFRATREDWNATLKSKKSISVPDWAESAKYVMLVSEIKSENKGIESNTRDGISTNSREKNNTLPGSTTRSQTLTDIIAETERAVFLVYAVNASGRTISQGSGFFIDPSGIGVSNYHVFKGGAFWYLRTIDGREFQVNNIIKESQENDHVVFTLKESGTYPFLKIAQDTPRKGEEIFVLGNPYGLESTVTRGIVSAIRDTLIQIDAAISPGSSGSPVMNLRGEVVGIATLKINGCENCNMAFDIKVIR